MNPMICLSLSVLVVIPSLRVPAPFDEPKPFLVVTGDSGQVVVDLSAGAPDAARAGVDGQPDNGIASWNGSRLASIDATADGHGHAVFVRDLLVKDGPPPFQATGAIRAPELIGWLGERDLVVVRDREEFAGYMLRAAQARLAKDSRLEPSFDITPAPGVYKFAATTRRGEVAYFAVRGNDRGKVLVWKDGVTREIVGDVWASSLCWSPDGTRLAVAEPGKLSIHDVRKAERIATFDLPVRGGGDPAYVGAMAWRPDGASIALLPHCQEGDRGRDKPCVWGLDPQGGTCSVLVELTAPARRVRWLDGTDCTTTLDEAKALALTPLVGSRR